MWIGSVISLGIQLDMGQIHSGLEKKVRLYVHKASFFNDEMDEFGHTPKGRGDLASLFSANFPKKIGTSRKCSKLLAVPCAFLLILRPNRLRLNNFLN